MSSSTTPDPFAAAGAGRFRARLRTAAVWLFIATLAWSPFPLGGAIAWASDLQEILIAVCWMLWVASSIASSQKAWPENRAVLVPLILAVLALGWACLQMLPIVPAAWAHPAWAMASEGLGRPIRGVISLNPWRTEGEILKLSSYLMAGWLVYRLARREDTAAVLLDAIIAIGTAYAVYALALSLADTYQTRVFYTVPSGNTYISGPFMLHNSFATYAGLVAVAATVKLFAKGNDYIVSGRGLKQMTLTVVRYCFGRGAPALVAALLTFSGVVASASRAGFASMMCGLTAVALASLLVNHRSASRYWAAAGALAAALPLFVFILLSGDTLSSRIDQLFDSGTAGEIRLALWESARHMIADAPWLGLGLGTFPDAYPLYATRVLPFVMDKAHCDYLEFAAGIGLPAAAAWWTAMIWTVALCLRGVRVRRRHRLYPLIAVGASVLVAAHSAVDFSLQLPAVALLYAALLGLGLSQALPTRNNL